MTSDILDLRYYVTEEGASRKEEKKGPLAMQNYSRVNQVIRRKMKQAKEKWITDRCKEIDCESEQETARRLSTL